VHFAGQFFLSGFLSRLFLKFYVKPARVIADKLISDNPIEQEKDQLSLLRFP
jgi:hypothetical protein